MRYPADHKDRVRERIVRAASRRFRGRGSEGVPITDLMRDLKLTHGGFYRHFKGKEALFNDAFRAAAAEAEARITAAVEQAPSGGELEAIISTYLSAEHCENRGHGCPIAALATEIARHPKSTREAFDQAIREHSAAMSRFMPGHTRAERQQNAMVLFASMAGALTLARATADPTLRRTILDAARTFYVETWARRRG